MRKRRSRPGAILTLPQVIIIKNSLEQGGCTVWELADRFDVSPATIRAIRRGETWRDVESAVQREHSFEDGLAAFEKSMVEFAESKEPAKPKRDILGDI